MKPGFLEKVFAQYDYILSHRRNELPPSVVQKPNTPSTPGAPPADNSAPEQPAHDEPPWASPADKSAPSTQTPAQAGLAAAQDTNGFAKLVGGALAIRGIQGQTSINALRAAPGFEALAEPLLGEAAGGVAATEGAAGLMELIPELAVGGLGVMALDKLQRNEYRNSPVTPGEVMFVVDGKKVPAKTFHDEKMLAVTPQPVSFKRDEEGLTQAYSNPKGTFYDPATKTEYVKGSTTATDWIQDFENIPFGNTAQTERYGQAMEKYDELTAQGQRPDRLVGHSLGGAVALQMDTDLAKRGHPVKTRTFGAPVFDVITPFNGSKPERYKHWGDPVGMLDFGATHGKFKLYPHSYTGYEELEGVK